jgi:hypothetical protein
VPNHTLKFPMVGGDSKLRSYAHTHTSSHTHTTHISKRKRDRDHTHTLAKWGSVSRKIKKIIEERFSAGVDTFGSNPDSGGAGLVQAPPRTLLYLGHGTRESTLLPPHPWRSRGACKCFPGDPIPFRLPSGG